MQLSARSALLLAKGEGWGDSDEPWDASLCGNEAVVRPLHSSALAVIAHALLSYVVCSLLWEAVLPVPGPYDKCEERKTARRHSSTHSKYKS